MITIRNLRQSKPSNPWDVKVDRSSVLGNPFYMRHESERDNACDQYQEYFRKKVESTGAFRQEIDRLCSLYAEHDKLNLFRWCAPNRCHAETIKAYIERAVGIEK